MSFFASPSSLLLGAITGLLFGFLLQKGGVTRFNVIVNQFLLRDFTVLKVMLTAIVVGSIGVYFFADAGLATLHVKKATLLGNVLGGAIFAVGMVVLGYCPGTAIAAIGDGAKDAIFGALGMFAGAALYAELHPWFKANVLGVGAIGDATLASISGLNPWAIIAGLTVVALLLFAWLERCGACATETSCCAGGSCGSKPDNRQANA